MILKSKFQILFNNTTINQNRVDESVKITDEFAIGFAEWYDMYGMRTQTTEYNLEIYKKEKGL